MARVGLWNPGVFWVCRKPEEAGKPQNQNATSESGGEIFRYPHQLRHETENVHRKTWRATSVRELLEDKARQAWDWRRTFL